jgi:hypothetical protein
VIVEVRQLDDACQPARGAAYEHVVHEDVPVT